MALDVFLLDIINCKEAHLLFHFNTCGFMTSNRITGREFLIFATDCRGYHEKSLLQIKILFSSHLNSRD